MVKQRIQYPLQRRRFDTRAISPAQLELSKSSRNGSCDY
jgi:hypothetical protein